MIRSAFVRLHRWVGLAMAGFLVVAGLTGSVIAFNHELDEWLNPDLFHVPSRTPTIPSLELAARIAANEWRRYVAYVPLEVEPGHALVLGLRGLPDPKTGQATDSGYYEVFVDPTTGAKLGEREWGACCLSRKQLIPFLYSIHYTLHLPQVWGMRIMGVVAMAWFVDCFVGLYLTLPGRRRRREAEENAAESEDPRPSLWARWKPAWRIKRGTNRYRLNFDIHRAVGLWLWMLFLTLAVSGVYLALRYEVFRPIVAFLTPITPDPFEQVSSTPTPPKAATTAVTYQSIVASARKEALRRGWAPPFDVFHSPDFGMYGVGFGNHHAAGIGVPYLYFDATTGRVRTEVIPGEGTAGDVFMQWQFPLHSGQILGIPGRILISLSGLALVVVTITGVIIWAKKRKGRVAAAKKREPSLVFARDAGAVAQRQFDG